MYHGTSVRNAVSILNDNWFEPSDESRMLGEGVYVTTTFEKACNYGPIILKVLVDPGRICTITEQGHPRQKTWQSDFGSAWVPPNTPGMVRYTVR